MQRWCGINLQAHRTEPTPADLLTLKIQWRVNIPPAPGWSKLRSEVKSTCQLSEKKNCSKDKRKRKRKERILRLQSWVSINVDA